MKKLSVMLVAAVVLVGLAALLSRRDQPYPQTATEAGQPLVPGFEDLLAGGSIHAIVLARGTNTTTTIELGEAGWSVKEQYGYPADFGRLQRVLPSLANVKIGQVLPGAQLDPENTTRVQWLDAAGKALGGIRIGQSRQAPGQADSPWGGGGSGGRFVGREGSESVYLVSESLSEFSAESKSWVDTQLLSVPATEIESVTITHPDGETVELARDGGDLTLGGLAENEEFDTSKRYGVGGTLAYLRFSALADPGLQDDATGLATAVVYRATSTKGQRYEVRIGSAREGSSERYARLAVSLAPAAPEEIPEDENEEAKTARAKRARERAELEKTTAELHAKLSPWIFLLSASSTDNMTHRRAALVKEKPEDKPEEETAAAPEAEVEEPAPDAAPAPAAAAEAEVKPAPEAKVEEPAPDAAPAPAVAAEAEVKPAPEAKVEEPAPDAAPAPAGAALPAP